LKSAGRHRLGRWCGACQYAELPMPCQFVAAVALSTLISHICGRSNHELLTPLQPFSFFSFLLILREIEKKITEASVCCKLH
jgi:hypothetical protein